MIENNDVNVAKDKISKAIYNKLCRCISYTGILEECLDRFWQIL
jgi:aerobic-type carbon monoxide dehydrogenase small subunit (CoxS/CutS family)